MDLGTHSGGFETRVVPTAKAARTTLGALFFFFFFFERHSQKKEKATLAKSNHSCPFLLSFFFSPFSSTRLSSDNRRAFGRLRGTGGSVAKESTKLGD